MKIRPVGTELFHAGGQTDMTKLVVDFRKFFLKRLRMRNFRQFSCELITC